MNILKTIEQFKRMRFTEYCGWTARLQSWVNDGSPHASLCLGHHRGADGSGRISALTFRDSASLSVSWGGACPAPHAAVLGGRLQDGEPCVTSLHVPVGATCLHFQARRPPPTLTTPLLSTHPPTAGSVPWLQMGSTTPPLRTRVRDSMRCWRR